MARIKLLFVEDEPDIRHVVELAIQLDPEFELTTIDNGVDAITSIEQSGKAFHFALLNLRLPHISGIELHERLRLLPGMENLVTAIITASVRQAEVDALKRSDIAGYIAKPFDPLTLSQKIRALLQP